MMTAIGADVRARLDHAMVESLFAMERHALDIHRTVTDEHGHLFLIEVPKERFGQAYARWMSPKPAMPDRYPSEVRAETALEASARLIGAPTGFEKGGDGELDYEWLSSFRAVHDDSGTTRMTDLDDWARIGLLIVPKRWQSESARGLLCNMQRTYNGTTEPVFTREFWDAVAPTAEQFDRALGSFPSS